MIGHHIDVIADHASQGAPDQPALAVLGGGELPKRYSHTHDPFGALSFAAAATRTLKLGNGVALVPQRARSSLPSRWRASTSFRAVGSFSRSVVGGTSRKWRTMAPL